MLTGYRSIITAVIGIAFIFGSRYLPRDIMTADLKNCVTELILAVYGIFMAAKVNRISGVKKNG